MVDRFGGDDPVRFVSWTCICRQTAIFIRHMMFVAACVTFHVLFHMS